MRDGKGRFMKGSVTWNKGLTKDIDIRIALSSTRNAIAHIGHIPWNKGLRGVMPIPWNKGKTHSDETKKKLASLVRLGITGMLGKNHRQVTKDKISLKSMGNKRSLGRHHNEAAKLKMSISGSKAALKRWQSEDYVRKIMATRHYKPNKIEKRVSSILERWFPGEWEYTGDGKVVLNRLIPDFININGKKSVIEIFGDYWHSGKKDLPWRATELGKTELYNALGFKSLIIWEHEINRSTDAEIANKVRQFDIITRT